MNKHEKPCSTKRSKQRADDKLVAHEQILPGSVFERVWLLNLRWAFHDYPINSHDYGHDTDERIAINLKWLDIPLKFGSEYNV